MDLLDLDAGEEGGESVEIILGPFLPGMIVALGALDASAEEDLADVGGVVGGVRIESHVPEAAGAIEMRSLAEEQLGDHLAVGLVLEERPLHVFVDEARGFGTGLAGSGAKELGEFERPDFGELRALEKMVDQDRALGGISRVEKLFGFRLRGQQTDAVEVDAAQELLVARQARGLDMEPLELGEFAAGLGNVGFGPELIRRKRKQRRTYEFSHHMNPSCRASIGV